VNRLNETGLSLIELLVTILIFGLIAAGATTFLFTTLNAHDQGNARYELYQEGLMIMDRLTAQLRQCTFLLLPNAHKPTRNILALSGFSNEDNDHYFGDPLFPKIDEDQGGERFKNDKPGIALIDDDGDGFVDEGNHGDDDEDGSEDEDPLDGQDNDLDGNVDEDPPHDENANGQPGIISMDDDGDGLVDEGAIVDDDEDGTNNEDFLNPLIYDIVSGTSTFQMSDPYKGETRVLSTRASDFQTIWETPNRIYITLTLTGDDGKSVTFSEYVHIENAYQRIGKRVR
jgi:prepilin-type N-terminal cleavage/methylation domain-containing protein